VKQPLQAVHKLHSHEQFFLEAGWIVDAQVLVPGIRLLLTPLDSSPHEASGDALYHQALLLQRRDHFQQLRDLQCLVA
jgi:hypothetical protein